MEQPKKVISGKELRFLFVLKIGFILRYEVENCGRKARSEIGFLPGAK